MAIIGAGTGLNGPFGIAVDSKGNIYVANEGNSVTEYAAGSNRDAKPLVTISGWKTGLSAPAFIAIGP